VDARLKGRSGIRRTRRQNPPLPDRGEEPAQDGRRARADAEGARTDATSTEDASTTTPGSVSKSPRHALRRLLWAAIGSLLLVAAFQELMWRWRRSWQWFTHPELTRPRTITDAIELGMIGLTTLRWLRGALHHAPSAPSTVESGT
jgi:hypothetical protein